MEELSLDNILSEDQIEGLFSEEETQETSEETAEEKEAPETKEEKETTEVNPEELFGEPESVGSEDNIEDKEDTTNTKGASPNNFYSSIANALVEDGIFQNLDSSELEKVKTAEDFAEIISTQVRNQFDERQKRIDEALNVGVEPTEIQRYESYLNTLNSITEDRIDDESEVGENLRKNIIYQDYINRGLSKERALKYMEKAFESGTDIEDAKEALQSNKEFFKSQYDNLIKEAKESDRKYKESMKKQAEDLKKNVLESEKAFGDVSVDKATRQKVYDSIMNPIYTDPETGEKITAIQKYELENKVEFLKNVGLAYVLTDGFKNIDNLVKGKVKKEIKRGIRELEHTINNTARTSSGSLNFASGLGDPNSKSTRWDLDI